MELLNTVPPGLTPYYKEKVNTYFNSRLSISAKFLDTDARIVSRDRVNDFKQWLDN